MEKLKSPIPGMWAQPYDPMLQARMRMDTVNAQPGNLTDYDCPKCKNRGYSMFLGEEGNLISRDCSCMTIRRGIQRMKRSGMEMLIQKTFDNFRPEQPWQSRLLQISREYLQHPDRWLVLCGQSGCGKTHLCSAVCRELMLQGKTVTYMLWRDASARLRDLNRDAREREQEKENYKQTPVLFIDDLLKVGGGAAPSTGEMNLAFEIINSRYIAGLRTVLSTELSPQQLTKLDQALGGRVTEMAGPFLFCVAPDPGKNQRMQNRDL